MGVSAGRVDFLLLIRDVDAIEARRIEAENFRLVFERQGRAGLLGDVVGNLERHELVDQPFGRPDGVVAAVEQLVGPKPEEQLRHHMTEITRARVDEGQRHRQPAVDVGLLRRDPTEVVEARQAAVLDDEVEVLERCRDVVDIVDVECVKVERNDGRALMDVQVLDPVFLRRLDELVGFLVGELVAFRTRRAIRRCRA